MRLKKSQTVWNWKISPGTGTALRENDLIREWSLTECFGTGINGGIKISGRNVQREKFRKVLWSSAYEYDCINTDCGNFTLYSADHFGFHRFECWDHVIQTYMWSMKTSTVQQTKRAIYIVYLYQSSCKEHQSRSLLQIASLFFFFLPSSYKLLQERKKNISRAAAQTAHIQNSTFKIKVIKQNLLSSFNN